MAQHDGGGCRPGGAEVFERSHDAKDGQEFSKRPFTSAFESLMIVPRSYSIVYACRTSIRSVRTFLGAGRKLIQP